MILLLFEDMFLRPYISIYDATLLCFLTSTVVLGELSGLDLMLYT